jgi:hypothetical protein
VSPVPSQPAVKRERAPRWTFGSRRLRVDCTAGAVLGAAAVATGSILAGGILLIVFGAALWFTSGLAAEHEAITALERQLEAERLLARLEPDVASVVKQRLGHDAGWDTSASMAPPA